MDFADALQRVSNYLASVDAKCAVVGGLALAVHGAGRLTDDVDIATESWVQVSLVEHLESLGYETLHRSEGYSNHAHEDSARGRINVVYLNPPTARDLFGESITSEIFPGVVVQVPRPEHLVAMKVLAAKNDPGRRLREMADIAALLGATGLAAESVRQYFERHDLIDEWERVRDSL